MELDLLRQFEKCCPRLCHAIRRKRHLTRKPHQGLYASERDLDHDMVMKFIHLMLDWRVQGDTHKVENLMIIAAINYERPTLFLEPGLGEALRETDLHEDFRTGDIHFPWAQFRLMLPKGLIRAKSEGGTEMGLNYLDAFIWPEGQQLGIQYGHAAELAQFASRMGEPIRATELAERLTGVQPTMDTVYMTGGTDHVVPDYQPDILTTQMPWNDVSLRERLKGTGHRLSGSLQDGTVNPALIELGRHLLYQVLLHIGQEPLYIEHAPTAWVRKPKMEGRHLKPGLVQAMYVGDLRPELWKEPVHREKGEPTGETHAAHWVRGHRRRQHFKGGVTKLIWIKPYKTGKQDID